MPPVTLSDRFERSTLPRVPAQDSSAFTAEKQVMIPGLSDQQRCYSSGMTTYRGKQVVALRIDDPDASGHVMGFYTFAAHPPFEIERMVQAPLVGGGFYNYAAHLVPYNISVVFPQGLVDSPRAWHVMYGKDDATLHVATVDKDRLLAQCVAPDADEHAR